MGKQFGEAGPFVLLFYDQPRSTTPMKAMIDALLELLRVLVDFQIAFFTLTAESQREKPAAVIQMQTTAVKMVLTKNSTLSFPSLFFSSLLAAGSQLAKKRDRKMGQMSMSDWAVAAARIPIHVLSE